MFDVLVDVAVFRKLPKLYLNTVNINIIGEDNMIYYLEEVPVASLHMFKGCD